MYAEDFEYDGRYLSDYGFIICNIGEDTDVETVSAGGTVTMQTVRYGIGKRVFAVNAIYESCIEADFTIAKNPCVYDDQEVTDDEERDLMRWLNRRKFLKMRLLKQPQNDDGGCYYNAVFNIDKIRVGGITVGFALHMTTDSPFGHGSMVKESGKITNGGQSTVLTLEDQNDDVGYIYPDMEVVVWNDEKKKITIENNMFDGDAFVLEQTNYLSQEQTDAATYYIQIQNEIQEKDVDLSVTVFGNIDTNDRQVLEWTDAAIEQFSEALESYGIDPDDMKGSVSTVLGSVGDYEGVSIAYSPILQTEDGPVLIPSETVDDYIFALVEEVSDGGEEWTKAQLLALDSAGLTVDGVEVSNIIADVGDTAERTSEIMHYTGKDGAFSTSKREAESAAKQSGRTLEELIRFQKYFFANQYTIDGSAMIIKWYEIYCGFAAFDGRNRKLNMSIYGDRDTLYRFTNGFKEGVYRFIATYSETSGKKYIIEKKTEDGLWEIIRDDIAYAYNALSNYGTIGTAIWFFYNKAPSLGSYIEVTIGRSERRVGDSFNYNFIRIGNTQQTRTNVISCDCPCTLEIAYEPIIKVSP